MVYKFLFREENVGHQHWVDRNKIVNHYYSVESNPFVDKDSALRVGISVADFNFMEDVWND